MGQDISSSPAIVFYAIVRGILKFIVGVMCILLVANYVLDMGAWKIFGVPVAALCALSLQAAVIVALFWGLLCKPLAVNAAMKNLTESYREDFGYYGVGDSSDSELESLNRVMRVVRPMEIVAALVPPIAALLVHDPLMSALGNPAADIITLVIVWVGARFMFSVMLSVVAKNLKQESRELYQQLFEALLGFL